MCGYRLAEGGRGSPGVDLQRRRVALAVVENCYAQHLGSGRAEPLLGISALNRERKTDGRQGTLEDGCAEVGRSLKSGAFGVDASRSALEGGRRLAKHNFYGHLSGPIGHTIGCPPANSNAKACMALVVLGCSRVVCAAQLGLHILCSNLRVGLCRVVHE